jgi:hypothetical protein
MLQEATVVTLIAAESGLSARHWVMTLYEQHTAERQADKEQGFVRHL